MGENSKKQHGSGRTEIKTPDLPVKFCAKVLGIGIRQAYQLITNGTLISACEGLIDPESLVKELNRRRGGDADGEESHEAAKRRKMVADANAAEIATAREAGKLVLAREVEAALSSAVEVAVQRLSQVGSSVGALVILETKASAAGEIINKANRTACEELAAMDIADIIERSREKTPVEEPTQSDE